MISLQNKTERPPTLSYRRGYQSYNMNPLLAIIAVNVLFFIIVNISPELVGTLGTQPATLQSHPWSPLTSIFVHYDMFHLFVNMLALYFLGGHLLRLMSLRNFLIIYFGGGLLGSVLFLLLGPQFSVAIGASGAIFAVGATLAVLMPHMKVLVFPIPAPMPLWIAIVGGFAILSFLPSVAWQGHLGGMIFGGIAGFLLLRQRRY